MVIKKRTDDNTVAFIVMGLVALAGLVLWFLQSNGMLGGENERRERLEERGAVEVKSVPVSEMALTGQDKKSAASSTPQTIGIAQARLQSSEGGAAEGMRQEPSQARYHESQEAGFGASVPTEYFAPGADALDVPPALEKYLDMFTTPVRFIGRLESITLEQNPWRTEVTKSNRLAQKMRFEPLGQQQDVTFNYKRDQTRVSVTFEADVLGPTGAEEVLIDWRKGEERIGLYFSPVVVEKGRAEVLLKRDEKVGQGAFSVRVYALEQELPIIGVGDYHE